MKNKNLLLFISLTLSFVVTACWSSSSTNKRTDGSKSKTTSTTSTENDSKKSDSKISPEPDKTPDNKMSETQKTDVKNGGFTANLPSGFIQPTDAVGQKMMKEYGAMFVAKGGATPPNVVVFKNEAEVSAWQNGVSKSKENIGGFDLELQTAAMKGLKDAIAEASQANLKITPRGADSARRDYDGTVSLWASRVNPGLANYVSKGKLTASEAARIKALSPFEQVPEIFKLESQGMFFSKDLSKSIIYSVAPPGTSQHISMLALDVSEHENAKVRDILAKHGWFQTVVSDLPHFTYLSVPENQLIDLGLKKTTDGGRVFWIPNI